MCGFLGPGWKIPVPSSFSFLAADLSLASSRSNTGPPHHYVGFPRYHPSSPPLLALSIHSLVAGRRISVENHPLHLQCGIAHTGWSRGTETRWPRGHGT